jgi:NAD(P)-dependent dehydrogenase (short-subunit alcohol dehydrogenase family)
MKIALITGSSRGLGKSMALNLAKHGYNIVITYKSSKKEADCIIDEIKAIGSDAFALQFDVSNTNLFNDFKTVLIEKLQTNWQTSFIDLLVNNAGIGINASIADTTIEQFDELTNIHIKGPYFLTQTLLNNIKDGGNIINISSGLARFSLPGYSAYAMMKGAVEVMTRYFAQELGSRNISVNTIAPGAIETDFQGGFVRDNSSVNDFIASQTALGRVGMPDDIGAALASIVSQECHWINGQRIEISGGIFL